MPKRVVIIGGGISGLAMAHRLCELGRAGNAPLQITLLEAKERLGGVIETETRDGFLLEGGPDSFISEKPWATELCERIGLGNKVMSTQGEFRRSFIVHRGKLVPVPSGFYLVAPTHLQALMETSLLSWRGKLRVACERFIPPRKTTRDESVASFIRRRLGKEALERIGEPMIGGIYTADLEQLSLEATFPRFLEMEQSYGSLLKGLQRNGRGNTPEGTASGPRYSLFLTLKEGMQELVSALVGRMREVDLRCCAPAKKVTRQERWKIELKTGEGLEAEALCLALPAPQAAHLVQSFAEELSEGLCRIPYESVATVNLAYRKADVPGHLDGFGFVVPTAEKRNLVGCTFTSVKFRGRAPEDSVLLRAFVGGALHREMFELDDATMREKVIEELRDLLGVVKPPRFVSIRRFPDSMPQYRVGHLDRVRSIENQLRNYPGLYLTGNAYHGIGIPDCIHAGERTAEAVHSFLKADAV